MEFQSIIEKIKSKINIRYIFSYVNEKRKYHLVKHRKILQDILHLGLQDYKTKSFELFKNIDFLSFLSTKDDINRFSSPSNDCINILKNKYEKEIKNSKLEEKKYRELMDEYIEHYFIKIYENFKSKEEIDKKVLDTHLIIDIFSPFYKTLMKKDIFQKLFVLLIPFPLIYHKNLMKEYYDATDLLVEENPNFSSFYFEVNKLTSKKELDDFEDFCYYFKMIKKLILDLTKFENSYKFPYEIFSYSNIKNNLIYLEIKFHNQFRFSDKFEKVLKELKCLEELRLDNIKYFHFGKNNIKHLYVSNCDNIIFTEDCYPYLQTIDLFRAKLFKCFVSYEYFDSCFASEERNRKKIKIPELIKFRVSFCYMQFSEIFDFHSCIKLKYFIRLEPYDFLDLGETLLEKVYISGNYSNSKEKEKKMFQKIMEIKTIKELKMDLFYISHENIEMINGENTCVEKLIIDYKSHFNFTNDDMSQNKIILNGIQKKFPNLKEFQIYISNYTCNGTTKIIISENENCKINTFKFSGNCNGYTTTFYTAPFEKLVDIEFGCIDSSFFNFDSSFPLFTKKCDYIFTSLKSFKFIAERGSFRTHLENLSFNAIKNIIDNLDKMPNLRTIILKLDCEIDKETYKTLIEKLLLSNIKIIEFEIFNICGNDYSKEELQNDFKNINIKKFEKIKIKKIN